MDNLETLPMDLDDAFTSAFKAAGSFHGELIDLEGDEGVKPLADKSKEWWLWDSVTDTITYTITH